MSRRRTLPDRFGSTGGVVRAQTLIQGAGLGTSKLEEEEQRRKRESEILEKLRPKLVPGEKIAFTSSVHGKVRGKFKQIDAGGRIVVTDSVTGLPLSCDPSQVEL